MTELDTIVELSHLFGTRDYVRGGGGNTSVKNAETLWVKPSGTTLRGLQAASFVTLDRAKIDALYDIEPPAESAAREELVKNMMASAVTNTAGRPSVEAPLHNVFEATYVVHTHPALVNGLTCARGGADACARLFPDALWVEYIDPGYTLCMVVRERIEAYRAVHGHEPALLVLQNHGIFISGNSSEEICARYAHVMDTLREVYAGAGVSMTLAVGVADRSEETTKHVQALFGEAAAHVTASGRFSYAPGPISPDHLVYAKAFPFEGELTAAGVEAYRTTYGYMPKVVVADGCILGIGTSKTNADLALELAQDGALVMQLASAFGGIQFMTEAQRSFIENWEVESYREKQATSASTS